MKNVLETKYFSFKLTNSDKRSQRTYSLKKPSSRERRPHSEKSLSLSSNDLLQKQEEILDKFEETRQAEEALAQNLKLLRKQKMRFHNLQKILSRNVILLPLCAVFTLLSAVTLLTGTLTDFYQYSSFNIDTLRQNIEAQNNISMKRVAALDNSSFNEQRRLKRTVATAVDKGTYFFNVGQFPPSLIDEGDKASGGGSAKGLELKKETIGEKVFVFKLEEKFDAFILTRHDYFATNNSEDKSYPIYPAYWGIWRVCNYLSEDALNYLDISKCNVYRSLFEFDSVRFVHKTIDTEYIDLLNSNPGRDLIRMHNAAACCVIVAYFLLVFSWITSLVALLSKSVPVTLTTSVLNALISVFLVLLLAIAHRKLLQMQRHQDCFDVKRIFGMVVCSSRTVRLGYSLGLTWLALICTTLNSSCWYHIAKMQKLLFTHGYYYN